MEQTESEPDAETSCAKMFLVPHRYIMAIMTHFALVSGYTMRICLSIAITEMVPYKNTTTSSHADEECPISKEETIQTVKTSSELYDWSEHDQGLILSSFFWGYLFGHLPGGVIAEYYGGKQILGFAILINAILTILTPIAIIKTNGSWGLLVSIRVIEGAAQGPLFPAINALLGQWIPLKERAGISNISFSGAHLGTILGNLLGGLLIHAFKSWIPVFYFFGGLSILWFILWELLCYSNPRSHPCLKHKEKVFLERELRGNVYEGRKKNFKMPWKSILTSAPVWALVVGQFGHDWGWFTLVTDLPKYMKSVLKFSVKQNAIYSSLPFILLLPTTIVGGYFSDWLINKNYLHITTQRKLMATIGAMGPAIFLVVAGYVGCNQPAAISMFVVSLVTMFGFYSSTKVNALDLSPNFAGTVMGIVNGIGTIAGMIAPYLVGVIAPDEVKSEWLIVFWVSFAMFAVTNAVYLIWGSGEVQSWNNSRNESEELNQANEGYQAISR